MTASTGGSPIITVEVSAVIGSEAAPPPARFEYLDLAGIFLPRASSSAMESSEILMLRSVLPPSTRVTTKAGPACALRNVTATPLLVQLPSGKPSRSGLGLGPEAGPGALEGPKATGAAEGPSALVRRPDACGRERDKTREE